MLEVNSTVGKYTVVRPITAGSFSKVYLLKDKRNMLFAGKVISRKNMEEKHFTESIEQEIRVHSKLHHQYIVELKEVVYTEDFIIIVTDYYESDLFGFITSNIEFASRVALKTLKQLLEASAYLEKIGIAHCDLKPENILIDQSGNIKICDFGSCEEFNRIKRHQTGTVTYMPPEAFKKNFDDFKKWDVWSIGIIIYTMFMGKLPWSSASISELRNEIVDKDIFLPHELMNEILYQTLKMCLNKDPKNRPLASEILKSLYYRHQKMIFSFASTSNDHKSPALSQMKNSRRMIIKPKSMVSFNIKTKTIV